MDEQKIRQSRRSLVGFAMALMLGAGVAAMVSLTSELLESGTPAPPFELPTAGGDERVSLDALRGKVILIDFWSTTCPPCVRQLGDLERVHQQTGRDDLVILGINSEGAQPRLIEEFARARGVRYPLLIDGGTVAEQYRVEQLPTLYLLDREGRVRWSRVGYTAHEELIERIRELI